MKDKNSLLENGYGLYYLTIYTDYPDRIEGLKESIQVRPEIYPEGVSILYVISNTDDRGVAILIKKVKKIVVPSIISITGVKTKSGL